MKVTTYKTKIVLRGEDGMTEHAQGMIEAGKFSNIKLVERNGCVYSFTTFRMEKGILTMFFDMCNTPVHIDEF